MQLLPPDRQEEAWMFLPELPACRKLEPYTYLPRRKTLFLGMGSFVFSAWPTTTGTTTTNAHSVAEASATEDITGYLLRNRRRRLDITRYDN